MEFRQILYLAANQAGRAAASPYGPELIVNGNMSSATGWTLDGDVPPVIAGGKMTTATAPDGAAGIQFPTMAAATFHTVITIDSITDGTVVVQVGSAGFGTTRTTAGTYTEDIAGDGTDQAQITMVTDGTIIVDNFSVKQVL